jgi:protein tyrosine/serine phosphatase
MTRHIDLDGVHNFRDFGGYDTRCGRGVRRGVLYRSANHAQATPSDLEALQALGIRTIVDLRKRGERDLEPSRRWAGFDARVIENDLETKYLDWGVHIRQGDQSARWFREDAVNFYRAAPTEERHIDLFTRYFQALAEADGPILVHCAAGKDRTGLICAFTHHIAGVAQDDILADYLLTNDEARIARRAESFSRWLAKTFQITVSDEAARTAQSVYPEYMQAALAAIDETYGSLDGYLERALGVDQAMRDRIHDKILG